MILGMTLSTIITQTLALICNTYTAFSKNNKNIYIANCLFNIFAMITGIFQKDYGLCISYVIVIYRSIGILYKQKISEKTKYFPGSRFWSVVRKGMVDS